jgi:hypothetical protein
MLAEVILGLFVGVELLVCCSMPQLDEVGLWKDIDCKYWRYPLWRKLFLACLLGWSFWCVVHCLNWLGRNLKDAMGVAVGFQMFYQWQTDTDLDQNSEKLWTFCDNY